MTLRILALSALVALGACAPNHAQDTPPAAVALADTSATDPVLRHVEVLASDAMRGRRAGENAAAQEYIFHQFREIGLRAFDDGYRHLFGLKDGSGEAVNLVGYLPGTGDTDAYIVVTAHYDHLGVRDGAIYNGADDNASGVAALLAAAAHFAEHPPRHGMIFAALDAEEMGLQGARQFVAAPPVPLDQIALNVNLDMVSESDDRTLFAAGTYHYPELKPLLDPVAERAPIHLRFGHDSPDLGARDDWTLLSDHGAFHEAGIPFVYFGVEDHDRYHKPTDDYALIDHDFFLDVVATIIDALETLDAQV